MQNLAKSIFSYLGCRQQLFSPTPHLQFSPSAESLLPASFLLKLPPELRLQIYGHIFCDSKIWVDLRPGKPRSWQIQRRSTRFCTNGRWAILLTCTICFAEAHRLYVSMTRFSFHHRRGSSAEVGLIAFAESISESSRLNLVELWDFLEKDPLEITKSTYAMLCIQAIPLFPSIKRCVISRVSRVHTGPWMKQICNLPTRLLTRRHIEQVVQAGKYEDHVLCKFVNLLWSEEYEYMGHIDFVLILRLNLCGRCLADAVDCEVHQYDDSFEVRKSWKPPLTPLGPDRDKGHVFH